MGYIESVINRGNFFSFFIVDRVAVQWKRRAFGMT